MVLWKGEESGRKGCYMRGQNWVCLKVHTWVPVLYGCEAWVIDENVQTGGCVGYEILGQYKVVWSSK